MCRRTCCLLLSTTSPRSKSWDEAVEKRRLVPASAHSVSPPSINPAERSSRASFRGFLREAVGYSADVLHRVLESFRVELSGPRGRCSASGGEKKLRTRVGGGTLYQYLMPTDQCCEICEFSAVRAAQLFDHTDSSYSSIHSVYSGPAVAHPLIPLTRTRLCISLSPRSER